MFVPVLYFMFVCVYLQHGGDVNARNGMGDTPLHRAAFTGRAVSCYQYVNRIPANYF